LANRTLGKVAGWVFDKMDELEDWAEERVNEWGSVEEKLLAEQEKKRRADLATRLKFIEAEKLRIKEELEED